MAEEKYEVGTRKQELGTMKEEGEADTGAPQVAGTRTMLDRNSCNH